jgi:hypothetical protein
MAPEWIQKVQIGVFLTLTIVGLLHARAQEKLLDYLREHHESEFRRIVVYPSWDKSRRNARWRVTSRLSRFYWSFSRVRSLNDSQVTRRVRLLRLGDVACFGLILALAAAPWWLG